VIERCCVNAAEVEEKYTLDDSVEKPVRAKTRRKGNPTKCIYCKQMFSSKTAAQSHTEKIHKGIIYENRLNKEKKAHLIQKISKCIFCDVHTIHLRNHMLRMHADATKLCRYKRCAKFFTTDAEKLKHESKEHQTKDILMQCAFTATRMIVYIGHP
jgi:hypothetical protein